MFLFFVVVCQSTFSRPNVGNTNAFSIIKSFQRDALKNVHIRVYTKMYQIFDRVARKRNNVIQRIYTLRREKFPLNAVVDAAVEYSLFEFSTPTATNQYNGYDG